jgi:diguanylate cyclase (GGDEF)-like protein
LNGVRDAIFEGEAVLPRSCLTVSIGTASFPENADNAEDLVRCADEALYQAKNLGKNRTVLYDEI